MIIADIGKGHLGSALGTNDFMKSYFQNKISIWVSEIEKLAEIAITQHVHPLHMYFYIVGRILLRLYL